MKKKVKVKDMLILQGAVILFSAASALSKAAALQEFLSMKFILIFGIEIIVLGLYAVIWQQLLKRFDLSIAYANKAMVLLWYMVWAMLIFKNKLTIKNVIGVLIVIIGIIYINLPQKERMELKEEGIDEN